MLNFLLSGLGYLLSMFYTSLLSISSPIVSAESDSILFFWWLCDTIHYGYQFFSSMFTRDMGGEDVEVTVELSFMEAVQGCSKTITFQTDLLCNACGGSGVPPGTLPETCKQCTGSGTASVRRGLFEMRMTCPACKGSGKIVSNTCKSCKGNRLVRGSKSVKLDITPGKGKTLFSGEKELTSMLMLFLASHRYLNLLASHIGET